MAKTSPRLDDLKRQKAQLDDLIAQGVLTGDAARTAREKLEQEILAAVTGSQGAGSETGEGGAVPSQAPGARPSRALVAGICGFVLLFGVLGYAWRGSFEGLRVGPGEPGAAANAAGITSEQIESMVARLAEQLKEKPDDADGWAMLGRSYAALGRAQDAVAAYKKVVELRPKDAQALADLADGMAMANNRTLEGEPERLIAEAVKLDGRNVKALALAGTVAFNRSDYVNAASYWQRAIDASDPGSEFAQQLQGALNEARNRATQPPVAATAPNVQAATGNGTPAATAAAAAVAGRVTLAKSLAGQVAPGDTLFIFARAASGPKMPLAIIKKQAGDLPVEFQLDDTLAMSPAAKLSSAGQVVVGARISKSGNAMPQPGDLQVLSAPVALGTRGLALEIAEVVK